MQNRNLNGLAALIVFAQSIAFSAHASEPSAAAIVEVLTCNTKLTEQQAVLSLQSGWFREAGAAEDGFELVKPVQSEGVCIKQAKVFGAFGVFMAVGQVCDGKFDALKATFDKQFPEGSGTALESGQLLMGKSQTDVGMIYRGLATMPPKPTVGAREVAFLCARRMGGTQ